MPSSTPEQERPRRSKLLIGLGAAVLALVVAYVALELAGVDVQRRLWLAKISLTGPEPVGIWREHERYGWEHVPSSTGRQRVVPDFDVQYHIGPDGNRVTPGAPGGAQPVVLFLGGSFTFGHGVEDDECFPALLQKAWPRLRVVNAAVNAWGTVHALLKLEAELRRKQPLALVVYGFITHHTRRNYRRQSWLSDLERTRGRRNPYYEIEGKRLVFKGLAQPSLVGLPDSPQLSQKEVEITAQLVARMGQLCAAAKVPFHVVFLPDGSQYWPDGSKNRLDELLAQMVGQAAVSDLREAIDYASSRYPNDLHLQPHGHAALAEVLRPILEGRLPKGLATGL